MKFRIEYPNNLGQPIEHILNLIESKDYDHYTVWESAEYPKFRIVQEDYNYYKTPRDVEVLQGFLGDDDKLQIVLQFNEYIDGLLNRPIKVDVVIKQDIGNIPFEYGEIHACSYYIDHDQFFLKSTFSVIMNNKHGYCPVSHMPDRTLNDKFIKIDKVKIGYKLPLGDHTNQKYLEEEVFYIGHHRNGMVMGLSNKDICPQIEIKVSFLDGIKETEVNIENLEVFHGEVSESIIW